MRFYGLYHRSKWIAFRGWASHNTYTSHPSYIIGHQYYYYQASQVPEPTTSRCRHSVPLVLNPRTFYFSTMPDKRPKKVKKWSMCPNLHGGVVGLLKDTKLEFSFHLTDDELDLIKSYDTNVMGRFTCHNTKCSSSGWPSKQIAITMRLYRNNEYNARIWHQRCKSCNQLSKPILDGTYAERIAYRLKKWSGVSLEPPEYSRKDVNRPHHKDLCEGCKNGHCNYSALSEEQKLNYGY